MQIGGTNFVCEHGTPPVSLFKFSRRIKFPPPHAGSSSATGHSCLRQFGAGEGNRTLVCSLGSGTLYKRINRLAAKLRDFRLKGFNRLRSKCKTFLAWLRRTASINVIITKVCDLVTDVTIGTQGVIKSLGRTTW